MKTPRYPPVDYDGQFKRLVRFYFPQFMEFFLSHIHAKIDWSKDYEFLDKELEEIKAGAEKKDDKRADFLVKTYLKDGSEKWILIHLEVQSYFETDFCKRMFIYFYRALDRFKKEIIAGAIYVNDRIPKKFDCYEYNFHGTELRYKFNTFKVTDYQGREEELEKNPNIFALVTLACLYVIRTKKGEDAARQRMFLKKKILLLLKVRGYSRKEVKDLIDFIKIIITLPKQLEKELFMEMRKIASTNPDLSEIPEVDEVEMSKWFNQFMFGIDVNQIIAEKEKAVAKAKKAEIAKAKAIRAAKEIEKKALAQKELDLQESIFRMHQKLNLDATTIADVLKLEIEWVEKVLKKK